MKEITVLSGKGGTGKTSITAALATIATDVVFCDNDVDAADLHLILKPKILEEHVFEGAWVATIDQTVCTNCGLCEETCRYRAIAANDSGFVVNPFQCEGCRLCERICPAGAITSERSLKNRWYISDTRFGKMVHARMAAGEENSGKLVAKVRENAKAIAINDHLNYILNDGPPGIGCTTISAITGTNHILLVIEPSKSGIHDALRVVELARGFGIETSAIINKCDLNTDFTQKISEILTEKNVPVLAIIPFDKQFVEAMIAEKSITEFAPNSESSKRIIEVWQKINQ